MAKFNKEHYKKIHLKDMEKIGLDNTDYSILSILLKTEIEKGESSGIDPAEISNEKQEAGVFISLMQEGKVKGLISKEIDRRLLSLGKRRDAITRLNAVDNTEALMRVDQQIEEMRQRKESLFSKMDEAYTFVYQHKTKDWREIKKWSVFVIIDPITKKKTQAFTDKEVKALDLIGDWDDIITIMDQGKLEKAVSRAFTLAKEARAKERGIENKHDITHMLTSLSNSKRI
jgi:hypothetical protein